MWDLVLLMFWLPVNRVFLFPFTVLQGKVWLAWGIVAHGWTLSCFHNGTKFSSVSTNPYTNTHRIDIWAAAVLPPRQNKPSPLNLNVPGLSTSMGYLNYLLLFLSPNHAQEITRKSQWNIWLMYMSLVHYTSTKIWSTEHFIISQMCSIQNNQQCNGMDISLLFFFSCSCSTPAPVRQLPIHPSISGT